MKVLDRLLITVGHPAAPSGCWAGRRWLGLAATAVVGLCVVPADAEQGDVQRLMYVHVPAAWLAFLSFGVVFLASVAYLRTGRIRWDRVAVASAEIGVLFCVLTLVLGSLWGRPVWGTWWTWDPRLTTTVVLLLIYVGYLSLRSVADSPSRRAHWSAVVGVVGFVDVPIVHMSVVWWRSLHQEATVHPARDADHGRQHADGPAARHRGLLGGLRLPDGRPAARRPARGPRRRDGDVAAVAPSAGAAPGPRRAPQPAREVSAMHDLGYLVAGYGGTAAALVWYRWRLARRGRRARDAHRDAVRSPGAHGEGRAMTATLTRRRAARSVPGRRPTGPAVRAPVAPGGGWWSAWPSWSAPSAWVAVRGLTGSFVYYLTPTDISGRAQGPGRPAGPARRLRRARAACTGAADALTFTVTDGDSTMQVLSTGSGAADVPRRAGRRARRRARQRRPVPLRHAAGQARRRLPGAHGARARPEGG